MNIENANTLLRRTLLLDAIATGATALLLLLGAGFLSGFLGLPHALLQTAGLVLIPFVMLVAWTATRARPGAFVVGTIVSCNLLWVLASVALIAGAWVRPTIPGYVFVIAQALVVGVFAELQFIARRKSAAMNCA
jgi:hypothetical protein